MKTRPKSPARLSPVGEARQQTAALPSITAMGVGSDTSLVAIGQNADAHLLAALMDNLPDNIYFKDAQSRFIRVNRAMANYLGLDNPDEAIGKSDFEFFDRDHAEAAFRDEQEVMISGCAVVGKDERERHPGGAVRWVSTTKLPLHDDARNVIGTFGISRDITARKRAEDQLYQQAFYDALTHLPNRSMFLDRLEQSIRRGKAPHSHDYCVVFLDIDRFKGINDSLGHAVGDKLLIEMSRRLESCLRPGDTVARLGGDEFAILLESLFSASAADRVADRVHGAMKAPFIIDGLELYCTVSLGIAVGNGEYDNAENLLRDADTAMYQAKSEGRARHVVFLAGMHDRARTLLDLETDLRRAVDRKEFSLHYQPIVDVKNGVITGFESLLRWQHPTRGMVFPDQFIGLAEETGLICHIGLWSLEQACLQLRKWQDRFAGAATPPRISVNLSARQFAQPTLLEDIERVLRETGAHPRGLILELTESALMENVDEAGRLIQDIRALNIRVHIDDFGMGYSSLGQLERLAVDGLKIDRSFVIRMGLSKKAKEIVRTMVLLATNLDITVTTEGIETREQLAEIRSLGCDHIQGFLFSRAVPADEAEQMLLGKRPAHWPP